AHPHPVGTPGPYRVPTRLARLLRVRAPRCEWPGCGHRSAGCDLNHDRAHPAGPTCGCNLGPVFRRHHRLKQLLMSKTRGPGSTVTWTSPTGRRWRSPSQHQPPAPAIRPMGALPDPVDCGDPDDDQDGSTDLAWLDGTADRLRADDPHETGDTDDTDDTDPYDRMAVDGWGLALDDPYRWAS
ncbi:MAG: hypothetical protein JWN08_198, partial [Frankiales bacterium]|nr:hypothetical protein [Frankiales bacterium]